MRRWSTSRSSPGLPWGSAKKVVEVINFYYFYESFINSPASYHPHLQHIGEGEGGKEGEDARPAHRQPVSVAPGESFELCNFS